MRKALIATLIISLLLGYNFHPGTVEDAHAATIYYVDGTNGNDDWPGTEGQPWKTISKAANTLTAGDTVYVKSGTYYEKISPQNSGSSGNWITYAAYPGHTVMIDGTGQTLPSYSGLFDIRSKNYIVIEGFNIGHAHGDDGDYKQNNMSAGGGVFGKESDHITVQDCYVFDCGGSGIQFLRCSNILIDNNELSDCTDQGDQECISLIACWDFEISNNYVHDIAYSYWYYCSAWGPKEAIDAKVGSHDGSIHNNHTVGGRHGVYIDGFGAKSYNIDIYNNHCEDFIDTGVYINDERGGDLENIRIYNNIIHDSSTEDIVCFGRRGIGIGGQATSYKGIYITNNTVYNVVRSPLLIDKGGDNVADLYVRNNIFWGENTSYGSVYYDEGINNAENGYNPSEHIFTNNCYGVQGPGNFANYFGTSYITDNPQFVSASPGCSVNGFELQSNSPLIDAGTSTDAPGTDYNGNSRPSGSPIDIGAFEYGGSSPPPTNQPPVLGSIGNQSVNKGQLLQFTVSATDPDDTNLSYSASNLPSGASFDTNSRVFSWTPSEGQSGSYPYVHFAVSDGSLTDSEDITVTVNDTNTPPPPPPVDPPSIGFVSPTDTDNATVERDWTEVNVSVASTVDTSSFVDWDRSLAGYWDFNENSGSTISDGSTYSNSGNFVNDPQWTTGRFGTAINFDGTSKSVDISDDESLDITGEITLEAWVNSLSTGGYHAIVHKRADEVANYYMGLWQGSNVYFRFYNNGTEYHHETTSNPITTGNWHHVAVTFNEANNTVKIYVDGEQEYIDSSETGTMQTNDLPAQIGYISESLYAFNGSIDEVKIWNRALSQNEILASYNSTLNGLTNQFDNLSNGSYDYYAYTTDTAGNSAQTETRIITIAADIGEPPVLDSIGDKSVDEGQLLQFTISATDPEVDPLTYSASNLPSGASFDPNNQTFSWTPDYSQEGSYASVHFEVSDGTSTDSEDITIIVNGNNQAPILSPIGNKSVAPGQLLQFTISATDPDGSNLIYAAIDLPLGASFDAQTQTFTWTPSAIGVYTNVHFEISDGELTDSEDITITVSDQAGDWDVNQDGDVNVLDLVLIGQHWGETGSPGWIPEDVNQDGTIDVLDNIMIGQHWTS
ncbi:MAG: putative Ig domain-containing protein [Chloroflexi bacterium]|nr:putative Ig domain-containing protein [Chloroflexota bacterium]